MELDLIRLLICAVIGAAGGLFLYVIGLALFLYENIKVAKVGDESYEEQSLWGIQA